MANIGKVVADAIGDVPKKGPLPMEVPDDLAALGRQVGEQASDRDYIRDSASHFRTKARINRDGSLRSGSEQSGPGITVLQKLVGSQDERGLADAVRNLRDFRFTKDGSGAGGTGTLVEALTKPAWQHSGRQVKIVHMDPMEYLARSAKGHGLTQEELLQQLAQGDRTDKILEGMSEGQPFAMPYLDYRNGGFGQEGQHRAMAAAMAGHEKIPVAVMWNDVKTPVAAKTEPQRRMDAEGFDTDVTYLHGTEVYRPGNDKGRHGMTEKQLEQMTEMKGKRGVAAHVTLDPKFSAMFSNTTLLDDGRAMHLADEYQGPGGTTIPFHLKKGVADEAFDMGKPEHRAKLRKHLDEYVDKGEFPAFATMTPDEYSGMLYDLMDLMDEGEADFSTLEAMQRIMRRAGYRAFVDYENVGGPPTGLAVFDGEDMKSVFAKAEKFGKGSTFAGAAGATVALSQPDSAQAGTNPQGHPEMAQIAIDEGSRKDAKGRHRSYVDTKGYLTGGIGHLMTKEEKAKYPEGTVIPDSVVEKWFQEDMAKHSKEAEQWLKGIDVPEEVQNIVTNMMFNMGMTRMNGFTKFKEALEAGDWEKAADEMEDSKWYTDVGDRSKRLIARMRRVR